MWVSFLAGFLYVHFTTMATLDNAQVEVSNDFQFGSPTLIAGYHLHHIAAGVFFILIAGWIGIHYAGRGLQKFSAILYGVGLGFIVDEVGFIVGGFGQYWGYSMELYALVIVIAGLLMSTVYWPGFWHSIELRLVRAFQRHISRRGVSRKAPTPVDASLEAGATPTPAPEPQESPIMSP